MDFLINQFNWVGRRFLFPNLWKRETKPDAPQKLEVMKKILKQYLISTPDYNYDP